MGFLDTDKGIISGDRGWIILPINDSEIETGHFKNPHLASIEPNSIRGNHFHEHKTEYIYIFGGTARVAIRNLASDNSVEIVEIDSSSPVLLTVGSRVAHAIKNVGKTAIYLFCWGTESYDPAAPDVVEAILLD